MRDMTDEEYDALDKRLTDTVPTLGHTGTGFFSRKGSQVVCLDEKTAKILNAKAIGKKVTDTILRFGGKVAARVPLVRRRH
jgi:hypothetical protein